MVEFILFHGGMSLNSLLLLLLVNFVSGFRLELVYVYITHHKYQVQPHPSSWLSAACAAAIVHRNHFFHFYQQNKSSESKLKFRQASNRCRRVLEAANLHMPGKQESIFSQKLGSEDFWQIANSVFNKGKSVVPPLFSGPEVLSYAPDKAKLFTKNFS